MKGKNITVIDFSPDADETARALRNDSEHRICMDGMIANSVLSFQTAIMYAPDDSRRAFALASPQGAAVLRDKAQREVIYWKNRVFPFDSAMHRAIVEQAIIEKFRCHPGAFALLAGTGRSELACNATTDSPGMPNELFVDVLERIRDGNGPRYPFGTPDNPVRIEVRESGDRYRAVAKLEGRVHCSEYGLTPEYAAGALLLSLTLELPENAITVSWPESMKAKGTT